VFIAVVHRTYRCSAPPEIQLKYSICMPVFTLQIVRPWNLAMQGVRAKVKGRRHGAGIQSHGRSSTALGYRLKPAAPCPQKHGLGSQWHNSCFSVVVVVPGSYSADLHCHKRQLCEDTCTSACTMQRGVHLPVTTSQPRTVLMGHRARGLTSGIGLRLLHQRILEALRLYYTPLQA